MVENRVKRSEVSMSQKKISKTVLERLPFYLHYLHTLAEEGEEFVSATTIARSMDYGEVQVRKDLGQVSGEGKPRVGYRITELIKSIETFLGFDKKYYAVIVGAGNLGKALYGYRGFAKYGLEIASAFDTDKSKVDSNSGVVVRDISELKGFCLKNNVKIGIITVPKEYAQSVCDLMVESGILAIMNFASVRLKAPQNILIKNENIASSLAVLSAHLYERLK